MKHPKHLMKDKAIISALTLVASLAGYFYAKSAHKDEVPYVMIGGTVGALIGEAIIHVASKKKDTTGK